MGNFDIIFNKAKEFAGIASKKTGAVFEMSKLKIEQLNMESDLQKKYEILGELCYQEYKNKNDKSEKMEKIINEINILKFNIKCNEDNISDIKQVKICNNCGNKNLKEFVHCSKCGNKLCCNEINDDETTETEKIDNNSCKCNNLSEDSCNCNSSSEDK